jgi:hypothetical protein
VAHADRRLAEADKFGLRSVVRPDDQIRTLRHALAVVDRTSRARAA